MAINPSAFRASDRLLTAKKVAEMLGIGLTTLRHLEDEGQLIPIRVGHGRGIRRYILSSVHDYIRSRELFANGGIGSAFKGRPRTEPGNNRNIMSYDSNRLRRASDSIRVAGS